MTTTEPHCCGCDTEYDAWCACACHNVHPSEWTGEGVIAMLAANPEPPAWYEQPDR